MYGRVVTINNTHWPAYRKPGATLVDLRMLDPDDRSPNPRLVFRPAQNTQIHKNKKAKNWRCLMASEGNGFTHYLVSKEVVLGEACIIEQCNEWISLAFIKLGIDRPEAVIPRAFVENHALVPKTAN
ncbi:MAG: hypothetical protein DMG97_06840 [Acidobacteria bacterium]|nr:MAG: hypothetical protein DMG97_06840 [Acidobacteriota bacterium]